VQSALQQTPSTQCPLVHSASIEQAVPVPASGLQTPPRQKLPAGQVALVLQPVHWEIPQIPGLQSWVRLTGQAPEPSQNSASVATAAVHDAARHCVLCPGTTQALVWTPLQLPSHPVPFPAQAARGVTGLPFTGEQVPALPGRLQASHWPVQSSLQHTPSTQKLERH
jgi:hypothetical protein